MEKMMEHDEQMMEKWWRMMEKMMNRWWEKDEQMMEKWWINDGQMMGQIRNPWKSCRKPVEHDGRMMDKYRKAFSPEFFLRVKMSLFWLFGGTVIFWVLYPNLWSGRWKWLNPVFGRCPSPQLVMEKNGFWPIPQMFSIRSHYAPLISRVSPWIFKWNDPSVYD